MDTKLMTTRGFRRPQKTTGPFNSACPKGQTLCKLFLRNNMNMYNSSEKYNEYAYNGTVQALLAVGNSMHVRRNYPPCIRRCNEDCLLSKTPKLSLREFL